VGYGEAATSNREKYLGGGRDETPDRDVRRLSIPTIRHNGNVTGGYDLCLETVAKLIEEP
jgi:hypothetical protein